MSEIKGMLRFHGFPDFSTYPSWFENMELGAKSRLVYPPCAKRPHFQNSFLCGRFPIYFIDEDDKGIAEKSNLARRLIAKFK